MAPRSLWRTRYECKCRRLDVKKKKEETFEKKNESGIENEIGSMRERITDKGVYAREREGGVCVRTSECTSARETKKNQ